MAFNPTSLGIIADSIGGGLVRILSVDAGADTEDQVMADGYLTHATDYGLRVDDLMLVRFGDGAGLDIFRIESIDANDAGTLGAISAPNIANRRWVDVRDFVLGDDTVDVRVAVQAAIDSANGRELVFTVPTGESSHRYRVAERPTSAVWTMPESGGGKVIFEEGAYIDCSEWSTSTGSGRTVFNANGVISTAYPLTVDAFPDEAYVTSPTLAAALSAMPRGGKDVWVIVASDEIFTTDDSNCQKSENLIVGRIEGDNVYFSGFLRDTYYVVPYNAAAYIVTPCSWDFENISINGPGPFTSVIPGDRGLVITYGRGCDVRSCKLNRLDFTGIQFASVLGGTLSELDIRGSVSSPGNGSVSFGVVFYDGCQGVTVRDSNIWGQSQQYVLSGATPLGITRDILFQGCNGYGAYGGTFTQHSSHELTTYDNCKVVGSDAAFDIRSRNTTIRSCEVLGLPVGDANNLRTGVVLRGRGMQNLTVENCLFRDIFSVTKITASTGFEGRPYNIRFNNNRIVRPTSTGVRFDWPHDSMPIFGFQAVGNSVEGISTGVVPYTLNGPWSSPILTGNTARDGVGFERSFLLSSTHVAAGHGARVPILSNNSWEFYSEPFIANFPAETTANICLPQQLGGAGAFTLNGAFVRGAAAISPRAAVRVKSDGSDNSLINFTMGGVTENATGVDGGYFSSTVVGPTAGGTATFKYDDGTDIEWLKVLFVSHDDDPVGAVRVGTVADDDIVCVSQTSFSAQELQINGVGAYKQAVFGGPQTIIITCASNETSRYFWVYGTGEDGGWQEEKITGVSATTVNSRKRYRSVHSVTISAASIGLVKVGTASDDDCVCASQTITATAVMNGVLSVVGTAVLDRARGISCTSITDDNSGVNFTVVGTDEVGAEVTETLAGAVSTGAEVSVYGGVQFKTVAKVTASGATTGFVKFGTRASYSALLSNNHKIGSSGVKTISPIDSPYSALLDDDVIFADTTTGDIEILLTPIAFYPSKQFVIKNVGSGTNDVTLTPNSPDTIVDATLADGERTVIQADGNLIWQEIAS